MWPARAGGRLATTRPTDGSYIRPVACCKAYVRKPVFRSGVACGPAPSTAALVACAPHWRQPLPRALCLPALAHGAEKAVSADLAWGISSSAFAPTGQAISDIGASWVRIEFRWHEAEPSSKGSYDPNIIARYDQAIETARAAGAKVLVFCERLSSLGVRLPRLDDEASEPRRLRRLHALRICALSRQGLGVGGLERGEHEPVLVERT